MRGIANMPGPGGSLGMCALCGDTFMLEILTGRRVQTISVEGFDKDMCLHSKCLDVLTANGTDWRTLPEGPLRRAYEKAADSTQRDTERTESPQSVDAVAGTDG